MPYLEYTSDKKELTTIGYILIGFVIIYSFVSIPTHNIVEKLPQFLLLNLFFLLFGILLIISGYKTRKFIFSDNSLSFFNRKIVFEANYTDIDLVRIFHNNSSNEITLGIVKSDETTFSITNSFFSNEIFYQVILKLKELADTYEFGFENEISGLTL